MSLQKKIISLLSDGHFHSGVGLGKALGVSRTAVWKSIQALQEDYGLDVQAVQGRGYRLESSLELLDEDLIRQSLNQWGGPEPAVLDIHWSINSTNAFLMSQKLVGLPCGYAVLAEHQQTGRGRRGRAWVSPFAQNIYLSLLWQFQLAPAELAGLSLAAAVAINRGLARVGVSGTRLKWPNDILWQDKKLCGVLLEMQGEAAGPCSVVIGVGLNVAMETSQADDITQPWTDIRSISSDTLSRNRIAATILQALLEAMPVFEKSGLESFMSDWQSHDVSFGERVDLQFPDRCISGIARGIDRQGALLLERQGSVTAYHAGEVSLRRQNNLDDTLGS